MARLELTAFDAIVGFDQGYEAHHLYVINLHGERLFDAKVNSDAKGLQDWLEKLRHTLGHQNLGRVALATESPSAPWLPQMMTLGIAVFTINPAQIAAARKLEAPSAAKDDRRDSRLLAEFLLFKPGCYERLQPPPDVIDELRLLLRRDHQLHKAHHQQAEQLRDQLHNSLPQLLPFSSGADDPWLWQLLAKHAPTLLTVLPPAEACQQVLDAFRVRRLKGEELHQSLALGLLPHLTGRRAQTLLDLLVGQVRTLQAVWQEWRAIQTRVAKIMAELLATEPHTAAGPTTTETSSVSMAATGTPSGAGVAVAPEALRPLSVAEVAQLLNSLPGSGPRTLPVLVVEGWLQWSTLDLAHLRSYSGVAPVVEASGKQHRVRMRQACNQRLRDALRFSVDAFRHHDPRAKAIYDGLKEAGRSHWRALRGVGDRYLTLAFSVLRHRTPYDPARRQLAEA